MNDLQICEYLNCDKKALLTWVKEGLPHKGRGSKRTYEPSEVSEWLIDNGHAEPVRTAKTVPEVASHFHVSERIVFQWQHKGMPPRGEDGTFDLNAIDAWAAEHGMGPYARSGAYGGASGTREDAEQRISLGKATKIEIEVATMRKEVAPVAPLHRRVERRLNELMAIQLQFPERAAAFAIEAGMPTEAAGGLVVACREMLERGYDAAADMCLVEDEEESEWDEK